MLLGKGLGRHWDATGMLLFMSTDNITHAVHRKHYTRAREPLCPRVSRMSDAPPDRWRQTFRKSQMTHDAADLSHLIIQPPDFDSPLPPPCFQC